MAKSQEPGGISAPAAPPAKKATPPKPKPTGSGAGGAAGGVVSTVKKAAAGAAKTATSATAKADAAAKSAAATTAAETAASFGWSIAFFNSIPELKALLAQATAGGWSPARFTSALQGTVWFRHTTESQRKYVTLKATDPASFKQQIDEGYYKVQSLAQEMGSGISPTGARQIADLALKMGWSETHLRQYVASLTKPTANGNYKGGQAAALQSQFRALNEEYGVSFSEKAINGWVQQALTGGQTLESVKAQVQNVAASKYVALADRIKGGETVRQIADPYLQSYAKLLELNGENVNLDDPLIQRALQAKDAKGKPTTQTVYDFENTLRNDPRWAKTDNARDQMSSVANSVLKTFGLIG